MKTYLHLWFLALLCCTFPSVLFSQTYDCNNLLVSYTTVESRCSSTGIVNVTVTGGSGNYNYKVTGTVSTPFTSSNVISGLPPGTYNVVVEDVVSGCIREVNGALVTGNYAAPSFSLINTDVTCINGTDGSISATGLQNGRNPFVFKIVAPSPMGVGTTSSTGLFTNLMAGDYRIELRDSCGGIQTRTVTIQNYNWVIESTSLGRILCDSADVSFTLRDNKGNSNIAPSASFNGFTYGIVKAPGDTIWSDNRQFRFYLGNKRNLTLVAKDRCGVIKSVTWFETLKPSVAASVSVSNLVCQTFNATVTGKQNFTNAQYCLFDNNNVQLVCNSNGVFNSLPYGSYCIKITDICYDTVITRCFTQAKPVPAIGAIVGSSFTCNSFTATVSAQSNLSSPQFCLYNSANVLVNCNSTGVFTNLAFGTYCIRMQNNTLCYDTLIERCITIARPIPAVGNSVTINNRTCTTFRATVNGQSNLNNPQYCLYNSSNELIICNSTGIFPNLLYGTYCIRIINDPACYDTTINRCFTVTKNKPSAAASVAIENETCTTMTARITGQSNLNSPEYCLYTAANVLVSCNTTGTFNNIPYGSYCIRIKNDPACYDTTINRCFTENLSTNLDMTAETHSLCSLGMSEIHPEFDGGIQPYVVQVYKPGGILVYTSAPEYTQFFTVQLPDLPGGLKYKIVGTDACGNKDSVEINPFARTVTKSASVELKCPGSSWPNGYGNIIANCSTDEGTIKPSIIKKNATDVLINYTVSSGNNYTFSNLEPATYIVHYNYNYVYPWSEVCNNSVYDTIVVKPYIFPGLSQSSAYQCDNNSFSTGANVTGGVAPYLYEVIGSVPASPSINTAPQTNPVFAISNGTTYSLVRLRAVDACGNAALNDVSVLPLENLYISSSSNCYYNNVNLSVKSIPNATYKWYKKTSATDSVLVSTSNTFSIPYLLPSDTGMYVNTTSVNNGCLQRVTYRRVNGACSGVLSTDQTELNGKRNYDAVDLNWQRKASSAVIEYSIERATSKNAVFSFIGLVNASTAFTNGTYQFTDTDPVNSMLYYRLRMKTAGGTVTYSNIVTIKFADNNRINIYPNPVVNKTVIRFNNPLPSEYKLELYNTNGQVLLKQQLMLPGNAAYTLQRTAAYSAGLYVIKITDLKSGNVFSELLRFE